MAEDKPKIVSLVEAKKAADEKQDAIRDENSPDRVLDIAKASKLNDVVVIGWDAEGKFYSDSSILDGAEINWLLDILKLDLITNQNN